MATFRSRLSYGFMLLVGNTIRLLGESTVTQMLAVDRYYWSQLLSLEPVSGAVVVVDARDTVTVVSTAKDVAKPIGFFLQSVRARFQPLLLTVTLFYLK